MPVGSNASLLVHPLEQTVGIVETDTAIGGATVTVPEPATAMALLTAVAFSLSRRRRRSA
jgi:hypothetical protein